ncbi:MAG: hypothetical protein Q9214_001357 [Letrouitia sp. 1 TL-2023]
MHFTDPDIDEYWWESRSIGDHMNDLIEVLERPWFQRIWVLQEVAVSKRTVLQLSNAVLDWETLAIGCIVSRRLTLMSSSKMSMSPNISPILEITNLRRLVHLQKKPPALSLVNRYRKWNATDPRDKIYAFYGLATAEMEQLGIAPDYHRSIQDTYSLFAEAVLQQYRGSHLLSYAHKEQSSPSASWIPNWADTKFQSVVAEDHEMSRLLESSKSGEGRFSAAGSSEVMFSMSSTPGSLAMRGFAVAQIERVGDLLQIPSDDQIEDLKEASDSVAVTHQMRFLQSNAEVLQKWEEMAGISGSKKSKANDLTAYRRVMTLGRTPTGASENESERAFQEWRDSVRKVFIAFETAADLGFDIKTQDSKDWADWMNALVTDPLEEKGFWKTLHGVGKAAKDAKIWLRVKPLLKLARLGTSVLLRGQFFQAGHLLMNPMAMEVQNLVGRRLAWTTMNHLALVPAGTNVGDSVVLLAGGAVPYVFQAKDDVWELLGDAYVHGLMHGEAWNPDQMTDMNIV